MATTNKKPEDALKEVPYGTPQWDKLRKQVVNNLKKKYPGQYVLCVPGKIVAHDHPLHQGDSRGGQQNMWDLISNLHPQMFSPMIKFEQRSEVEYNLDYKQINVFTIIHDDEHMIVFRKANGEYSLPGGHVDFSLDAYRKHLTEFLYDAMVKEMEEEITNPPIEYMEMCPIAMLNTTDGWNDLFHMGIIYECHVPHGTLSSFDIESNELDKHVVEIVTMEDAGRNPKFHPWTKLALGYVEQYHITLDKIMEGR